jgi:hypothetical protein
MSRTNNKISLLKISKQARRFFGSAPIFLASVEILARQEPSPERLLYYDLININ